MRSPTDEPSAPVRALIIAEPDVARFRVGSLSLRERWKRSLGDHGVSRVDVIDPSQLPNELRALDPDSGEGAILVAWEAWAAEHLACEGIVEAAITGLDDDAAVLTAPGSGFAPVVVLRPRAARVTAELSDQARGGPDALTAALMQADLAIDVHRVDHGYWHRIASTEDAAAATWGLLERLRWRPGGIVAKWLNRPISLRISRVLVDGPVTPNQTTIFAFLLGLVGIWSIVRGHYGDVVVGTALLQLNSIIDGVDGELARIRHTTSEFGAYLDSVCDEVLNAALLVAVGYYLSYFKHPGMPMFQWIGVYAGIAAFGHALLHWHCKLKHGLGFYWWFEAYKPRREVQRSTSAFTYFKKLFWKESFLLLFLVTAILDVTEVMMVLAALAASAVYVLAFIHLAIKRARW